jgi:lycopene cyclase domain-containing protein
MYLATLLLLALISLFLEWKYNFYLYRSWRWRVLTNLVFFLVGIVWDTYATMHGWWVYPGPGTVHIFIGQLPIEEWLFYLIVPYFGIVVYKLVEEKFDRT